MCLVKKGTESKWDCFEFFPETRSTNQLLRVLYFSHVFFLYPVRNAVFTEIWIYCSKKWGLIIWALSFVHSCVNFDFPFFPEIQGHCLVFCIVVFPWNLFEDGGGGAEESGGCGDEVWGRIFAYSLPWIFFFIFNIYIYFKSALVQPSSHSVCFEQKSSRKIIRKFFLD